MGSAGIRTDGRQHRHVVGLELGDDGVVRGADLDDHEVGLGAEQRLEVRLLAGADVGHTLRELLRGDPRAVALGVGDRDRGDAQRQRILDLLPLEHRDPLGGLVELDRAAEVVRDGDGARRGRGGVVAAQPALVEAEASESEAAGAWVVPQPARAITSAPPRAIRARGFFFIRFFLREG